MQLFLERFIVSSTPSWRVLLAVFSSTPFFLVVLVGHGLALNTPGMQEALNPWALWPLEGWLALATLVNLITAWRLWPHRDLPDAVPQATMLVCLAIGPSFTLIAILAGTFTTALNLVLLGVLAIGLLLFERRPMLIAYGTCVAIISAHDLGVILGWWVYAPAFKGQVMQGREPVWWFHIWRQFVFVASGVVMLGLLGLLFDRLDQVHAKLRRLSYTDGLTGLANRRRAMEVLHNEVARQARTGQPLSLVLIDADHFKQVNDQHGHDVGDQVLRTLGSLLLACVRSPTDVACRLGGEEFALILPDTRLDHVEAVCERLRQQLARRSFGHGNEAFKVTLSMGAVEGHGQGVESLLQQADQQLYRAKSTGRDRLCMAAASMGSA